MKSTKGVSDSGEPYIKLKDVAKFLDVSESFVKKAQKSMGMPHYKLGTAVKFLRSEVNEWMKQRKVAG